MISNVSFNGKVFLAGSTKYISKDSEVETLKTFADKTNSDIVVLDRDYYSDNTGIYETLVIQDCGCTGKNTITKKTFDFNKGVEV